MPAALVVQGGALAVVEPGAAAPAWTVPGAVAALDGSAAYRADGDALVRLDLRTGEATGRWPLPSGAWHVAVVSPGGQRVVVTDGVLDDARPPTTTRLALVDTTRTEPPVERTLPGALEPEALSVGGDRVFVLDHRPDYYRVRAVSLGTGAIDDVFGRDKSAGEDMVGEAVRAVLSPDGTVLATLYREPTGHHPFVHVLHLANGWAYCADLPAKPYESIANTADGRTVYVGAADGSWVSLDLSAFGEPSSDPLPLADHHGTAPPVPLARGGTIVRDRVVVTADATGVTWSSGGATVGRFDGPVERLVGLLRA